MARLSGLLVFLAIALSLLAGLHYYFWARLVRDTALPSPWRPLATWALIALGSSVPLALFLMRTHHPLASFFTWPGYVWLGTLLILATALVGSDLVRLAVHLAGGVHDPERRLLFRRVLAATAASATTGLGALGLYNGLKRVAVREVEVTLPLLPRALDGFTIVQLTDLHVGGQTLNRGFVEEVVAITNRLSPDLVAITGDLIDGSVASLAPQVAPLAQLQASHGTFFVTGNHEYYSGADAWLAHLPTLDIRCLRNERVAIGEAGAQFDLAGIDDFSARDFPGHGPDLPRALAGRDPARALVLLAHQPRAIREAAAAGVSLQLSGHTHGGQIWPWSWAVLLQQPYVAGLHRHGETQIYVSRGTGYWGPPMRLDAPAEITRIRLRADHGRS